MLRERAQAACDAAGLGGAIALSALIIWGHPQAEPPAPPPAQAQPVQLSVVEAPPAPPAPPAASQPPPAPEPPPPPPPPPVQQTLQPLPLPPPQRPPAKRPPPRHQTRVQHLSQPETAAEAPASAASPSAAPAAHFDLPPSQAPARDQTADDAYVGGLHATLVRRTVPPQSAQYRLLRPNGTTDVGFTLARSGAVANVHVISSSGSPLLDAQALAIVRDGAYPPFPAAAFAGEPEHVFHIPIRFLPAGSGE